MRQTKTIDGWTVVHVLSGVVLAMIGADRTTTYGLTIGTEFAEFWLSGRSDFFQETPANVAADIASTIGAYELTRLVKQ